MHLCTIVSFQKGVVAMNSAIVYVHGRGSSPKEADRYRQLFRHAYDVIGFDYASAYPWEAQLEFPAYFSSLHSRYSKVLLIAQSIGAYFSLVSLSEMPIEKAMIISPIVDMEKLILAMMERAGVTEDELHVRSEIKTPFGERLSWTYLTFAREHPITWGIPTSILYAENDAITSLDAITDFAHATNAELTVMPDGEHWFHTEDQMKFLDDWITRSIPASIPRPAARRARL